MKEPLLFSGFLQTDYVELAHCFTPLQSDGLRKKGGKKRKRSSVCVEFEITFARAQQAQHRS